LRAAKFAIDESAIRKGLASVDWPARLQRLTRGPLAEALPPGCELWLDGGHNEDCGIALARMAADWAKEPAPLPLYLVFGMLTTKDASGFLRPLARHAQGARAVPFPEGHSAYTPGRGLRQGGRGRPRLRSGKRRRRGAGGPVGHPARADAHSDLWVALPRGRRAGPQRHEPSRSRC
jgi:hypothetical protein